MELEEARKVGLVNKIVPDTFDLNEGHVSCKYCVGDTSKICLSAKHGSFESNLKCHLKSKHILLQPKEKNNKHCTHFSDIKKVTVQKDLLCGDHLNNHA